MLPTIPELLDKLLAHRPLSKIRPNNRGNSKVLKPGVNGINSIASVVETPKTDPAREDAEVITVTLGLEFVGLSQGSPPDSPSRITANLEWGVGGASYRSDVDWVQGLTFSIAASYLRVGATYNTMPAGFGGTAPDARLSASLAYGPMPGGATAMPTLTQTTDLFGIGASKTYTIPRFARAVSFVPPPGTLPSPGTGYLFQFFSGVAAGNLTQGIYEFNDAGNKGNQLAGFPIPSGAYILEITNQTGGNHTSPGSLIWHLAL